MIEVLVNYTEAKNKSQNLYNKVNIGFQIKDIVNQYESAYQEILK